MNNASPWAYSHLKAFDTCPLQFYHMKVKRTYVEPETESMRYGNAFHKAAENYIGKGAPLPTGFMFAKPSLDALNNQKGEKLCEYKMGLTSELKPCGFFDDDVWYRGVVDLCILDDNQAKVVDYKTGKSARYADTGQLELMALATFSHFPDVEHVKGALLFVLAKALIPDRYSRSDVPKLWEKWLTKHAQYEKAFKHDVWNPRPSGLCRQYCAVLECAHNGRR